MSCLRYYQNAKPTQREASCSTMTDEANWPFRLALNPLQCVASQTVAQLPHATARPKPRHWQRRRTGERVPHWMR